MISIDLLFAVDNLTCIKMQTNCHLKCVGWILIILNQPIEIHKHDQYWKPRTVAKNKLVYLNVYIGINLHMYFKKIIWRTSIIIKIKTMCYDCQWEYFPPRHTDVEVRNLVPRTTFHNAQNPHRQAINGTNMTNVKQFSWKSWWPGSWIK